MINTPCRHMHACPQPMLPPRVRNTKRNKKENRQRSNRRGKPCLNKKTPSRHIHARSPVHVPPTYVRTEQKKNEHKKRQQFSNKRGKTCPTKPVRHHARSIRQTTRVLQSRHDASTTLFRSDGLCPEPLMIPQHLLTRGSFPLGPWSVKHLDFGVERLDVGRW